MVRGKKERKVGNRKGRKGIRQGIAGKEEKRREGQGK